LEVEKFFYQPSAPYKGANPNISFFLVQNNLLSGAELSAAKLLPFIFEVEGFDRERPFPYLMIGR